MTAIVWFRQDLRLADNPALAAGARCGKILAVYILDDITPGPWRMGGASRWWLHHSLASLRRTLGHLVLRRGDPLDELKQLVADTGATHVFWNRCYEPFAVERDRRIKAELARQTDVQTFNAALLHEPWDIKTGSGEPFKVFTPFWRAASRQLFAQPLPCPKIELAQTDAASDKLEDWHLTPGKPDWAADWLRHWTPGEAGARARLDEFLRQGIRGYGTLRDRPDLAST
jgi:deoxyribodipyrimidine photo-lyase